MSDSNPVNPSPARPTLKLKLAARKPREENSSLAHANLPHQIPGAAPSPSLPHPAANSAAPRSHSKLIKKPGAALSDELKHRMQADMDALLTR